MFDMKDFLCTNGSAIVLMLIILQSSYRMFNCELLDHKIMNNMIVAALIGCVLETTVYLNNCIPGFIHREIIIAISTLSFICNSLFSFIWVVYADYKLFSNTERLRKRMPVLSIPALLIVLCSIVNLFTPVFFTVDKYTNIYQRSDLYFVPNIIVCFYLIYGTVLIYNYRNKVGKYLFLPAIIFMIPVIIGASLDFIFYGVALKQIGIAIGLTSIYLNVQKEISCTDSLSGLHTRQYMINYLINETNRSYSEKTLVGILIDIDKFKSINDTYGHLTGDDAIRSFGFILRNVSAKNDLAVRFAGDEFLIIQKYSDEIQIQNMISAIIDATEEFNSTQNKPYKIQFSFGYSIFNRQTDTIDTFFERMDNAMYEQKKEKKKSKVNSES